MRSTGLGRPPRHSGDRSAQVTVLFDGGWQCVPQGWAGHRDTAATVTLKSLCLDITTGSHDCLSLLVIKYFLLFLLQKLSVIIIGTNCLQEYADDFYTTFNNQPFNSIEPDLCHLVYVAKVETIKESQVC